MRNVILGIGYDNSFKANNNILSVVLRAKELIS